MSESASRGLVVETVSLPQAPDLFGLDSLTPPLLWWRHGSGMVGLDQIECLSFTGPSRIIEANAAWNAITRSAEVHNTLSVAGTGLVAWGTFTFSAGSAAASRLVIPRVIVGVRGDASWLTRIRFADEPEAELTIDVATQLVASYTRRSPVTTNTPVSFSPGQLSTEAYRQAVLSAVSRIDAGAVEKVVLARDLVGTVPSTFTVAPSVQKLSESYPDCWTFSVDGLFGSSPETLVSVHGHKVSARVLAGTTQRGSDTARDLAQAAELASSTKDLDEHGFATRSVVDALRPFTQQLTASDEPFTLKLPNLWHLATDISATLVPGASSLDLVAALHPTAAVAGTPTGAAVEVISELEPFDRGRYAGPVGWISADGDGEWAIALRCAQIEGDTVTAYAGGGILADSIPEMELAETEMKFRPIVEALG